MVTDSHNKPIALTRYGHSILGADAKKKTSNAEKITVSQGYKVSHPILLNRIFDMTISGDYKVWVKCTAITADGKTEEYVSDKIMIRVP